MRRFLDQKGTWESHLQKTRQSILNEFYRIKPKSVAILGSGWLLDVPLQEIIAEGVPVKLIDIAHPSRIKHKFRGNSLVDFIDYDLTKVLEEVLHFPKIAHAIHFQDLIRKLRYPAHSINLEVDLCISVNTLSQLHVLYADFLSQRKKVRGNYIEEMARAVQLAHLDFLPKGKSLMISDFEEELYDDDGVLKGVAPRLFVDLEKYEKIDSWSWNFDTRKAHHVDYDVKLNVISCRI